MRRFEFLLAVPASIAVVRERSYAMNTPASRFIASARAAQSVTVYHVPDGIASALALTPERVRDYPNAGKLDVTGAPAVTGFLTAIEASDATATQQPFDARWYVELKGEAGRVLATFACDRFVTGGSLDATTVTLTCADVKKWLGAHDPLAGANRR